MSPWGRSTAAALVLTVSCTTTATAASDAGAGSPTAWLSQLIASWFGSNDSEGGAVAARSADESDGVSASGGEVAAASVDVVELTGERFTDADIAAWQVHEIDQQRVDEDMSINVVGGALATSDEYPWLGKLLIKGHDDKTRGCGGTLVSSNIVVTAQHCVDKARKSSAVSWWYGDAEWREGTQVTAKGLAAGDGLGKGDWAVIKLSDNVDDVPTPSVAGSATYTTGPTFWSAGWGRTSEGGELSNTLYHVELPYIPDDVCGAGKAEICAGDWDNGGIDTCSGDSGGPLVSRHHGDLPVLVGVVSWGKGCAQPQNPGHYTDLTTYVDDIRASIRRLGGQQFVAANESVEPAPAEPLPTEPAPADPTPADPAPAPAPIPQQPNLPGVTQGPGADAPADAVVIADSNTVTVAPLPGQTVHVFF